MRDLPEPALAQLVAPVGEAVDPPAALRDRIASGLAPAPRRARWRLALPVVAVSAAIVMGMALLAPRGDLAQQPLGRMCVATIAWALGTLTGLAMLHAPGRYGLGPSAHTRVAWLAGALAIFEAVAAWSTVRVDGSVVPGEGEGMRLGLGCALEASLPTLLTAWVIVRLARGTAIASPWSAALVAGAAAGFVGTLTQQLVCPVAVASHTMTAHAAPVLIGALAALLLARRTLSATTAR